MLGGLGGGAQGSSSGPESVLRSSGSKFRSRRLKVAARCPGLDRAGTSRPTLICVLGQVPRPVWLGDFQRPDHLTGPGLQALSGVFSCRTALSLPCPARAALSKTGRSARWLGHWRGLSACPSDGAAGLPGWTPGDFWVGPGHGVRGWESALHLGHPVRRGRLSLSVQLCASPTRPETCGASLGNYHHDHHRQPSDGHVLWM